MSLSDDLRDELAQIAPRAALLPARRAVGALPRLRRLAPARRRASPCTSTSRAPRPRGARSRSCATSASARRSAPIGGRRSTARRATSCTSTSTPRALDVLREAGVLSAVAARRSSSRRSASSAARAAAAPTCAARCSAAARSPARATRISRCGRAALDGARFIAEVAAREDVRCRVAERRNHAVAYAKGHEAIGDLLALAGASDTALRLEEHAVVAATRASANRLANADEANLVRTARAAHAQLEAIRALDARRPAAAPRRDRRAAAAPPVRVAARARGEGAAADHEGGRPPAAAARSCARGRANLICNCSSGTREDQSPYSAAAVRARPAVNTDPVRRRGSGRGSPEGEVVLGAPSPDRH